MTVLSKPLPADVTATGRERVAVALLGTPGVGCDCAGGRLCKRHVGTAWGVTVQCLVCGRAIGGSFKRADFPSWASLPEWDGDLPQRWEQEFHGRNAATFAARRAAVDAQRAETSRAYADWCSTSPEWAELSARVIRRAGGMCEACLTKRAAHAHHINYALGKLPPAWHVRAVCARCHARLHADKNGAEDDWCQAMPRAAE